MKKIKQEIDNFIADPGTKANRPESTEITLKMHNGYSDVFTGICCFKGTFYLQVRADAKPYQTPTRSLAYALKGTFKTEMKRLQEQEILAPLGVDKKDK